MDIEKVILNLVKAEAPSKNLDAQIALAMGFGRHRENFIDANGHEQTRSKFFDPITKKPFAVPSYTSSVEDAKSLAELCAPGVPCAVAWLESHGEALIQGYKQKKGCTPAVALCIAALIVKSSDKGD